MNSKGETKESSAQITVKSMLEIAVSDRKSILDEVMRVEQEAWPEEWRASREKFESRMKVFPEGFFLGFVGGRLAGVTTSEITDYDKNHLPTNWDEVTGNGFIKTTHQAGKKALYVVSVGVSQNFSGKGVGQRLVESQNGLLKV